jgi:hypothetical protein
MPYSLYNSYSLGLTLLTYYYLLSGPDSDYYPTLIYKLYALPTYSTLPYFTLLYLTLPYFTLLHLTLPYFISLYLTSPYFPLLYLTLSHFTLLYLPSSLSTIYYLLPSSYSPTTRLLTSSRLPSLLYLLVYF